MLQPAATAAMLQPAATAAMLQPAATAAMLSEGVRLQAGALQSSMQNSESSPTQNLDRTGQIVELQSVAKVPQENASGKKEDAWWQSARKRGPRDGSRRQCEVRGCTKQPMFGVDPGKVRWCKAHAPFNAKDVIHKHCEHPGCTKRPNYGMEAKRPRWCITHAPTEARDVVNKQCSFRSCTKQPYYGLERRKPLWCKIHAPQGTIDVVHKLCEGRGCVKRPSYGLEPKVARWCKECAPEGIDDVVSSGRNRPVVFGWKGTREEWHALSRAQQDQHWQNFQKLDELRRFELRRATLIERGIGAELPPQPIPNTTGLATPVQALSGLPSNTPAAERSGHAGTSAQGANGREIQSLETVAKLPEPAGGKTSRFRGVSWSKPKHRWQACIRVARRQFFLGRFQDEREAAAAYDRAALRHYPADAVRTNFPVEMYLPELESIREGKPPTQANPRRQALRSAGRQRSSA